MGRAFYNLSIVDLNAVEIPELLANLVDRSLVIVHADTWRYHLSESMRAFASEQIADEGTDTWRRHFDFFVKCGEHIFDLHERGQDFEARKLIEVEIDNLRTAFDWGLKHDPDRCLHLAACICGALDPLWRTAAREILTKALAATPPAVDKDHVRAKLGLANTMAFG